MYKGHPGVKPAVTNAQLKVRRNISKGIHVLLNVAVVGSALVSAPFGNMPHLSSNKDTALFLQLKSWFVHCAKYQ